MLTKADLLAQLQKDVLSLQGFKPACTNTMHDVGLGMINNSFPNNIFPLAALHEFFCADAEEATSSGAFITGLLSSLMRKDSISLWISSSRSIFPPALHSFGINPDQIVFVDVKKQKEVVWAVEEALHCKTLTAVISEMPEVSFTNSRRFQLAIEQSGVPCFVLRRNPRNMATVAVTRWRIKSMPSNIYEGFPGVGYSCWQVELLKVRNGKTGSWTLEWINARFHHVSKLAALKKVVQKKTG